MTVLLQVEELVAGYGSGRVINKVSFTVSEGGVLSLMGRNGMGKTTLLRTIMGLTPERAGTIRFAGVDLADMNTDQIAAAGIAYVPENRGVFPNLTVRENLLVAARPGAVGAGGWHLDRMLSLFPKLGERLDQWGNTLSGGEQQMLTIGRALMTNPQLLLLDEATEGLAPMIRDDIWRVLGEIKRAGVAVIVVDRNVEWLLALADQHLVLNKGQIVFSGDGPALQADPDFLRRQLGV